MGDLIGRSALLEFAHNHVNGAVDCNDIARFPDVDAEPVRHGKWSKDRKIGDVWCCSECGFGQLVSASFMYKEGCIGHTDNRTRFCPNCGARMDAEENT